MHAADNITDAFFAGPLQVNCCHFKAVAYLVIFLKDLHENFLFFFFKMYLSQI